MQYSGVNIISTERLILRPFRMEDAEVMFERWASDKETVHYLSWMAHQSLKDTKRILKVWMNGYLTKTSYVWAICPKSTPDQPIGSVSLHSFDEKLPSAEAGYVIARDYWNQGYASEALRAVLEYGLDLMNLHRISAYHHVDNEASGRVMEKAGMTYEGCIREAYKDKHGNYMDVKQYSVLHSDLSLGYL